MTNGEKFKEVFQISQSQVDEGELYAYAWLPNHDAVEVSIDWWNAEYKEPTTKNDLGVDCVARQDVERFIEGFINEYTPEEELEFINLELDGLKHLPPATPQEPMVEIDLYSVIKQKYIEREVLDKLRAEIDKARFVDKDTRICKNANASGLEVAMQIIDKYRAEGSKEA